MNSNPVYDRVCAEHGVEPIRSRDSRRTVEAITRLVHRFARGLLGIGVRRDYALAR
ncbi:hypothetical protein LQK89_02655 [Curtobacterium sp. C1]|uniref:hypothetical protein n=1 Tax=Curtobacterium sp. C1 TaxID=2898151 RepID=UPI001E4C6422|nr:hypothetical protein [Curtobacterium sp. C1]UFU14619.1 hypothetical protein LQK89_02655 [Curtobacterium sp. C1]